MIPTTDKPLQNKYYFTNITEEEADNNQLKYHQYIVVKFFTDNVNSRGFLINHKMGQGKTRLAVAIADRFVKSFPEKRVIILSAKSLAENFRKEAELYIKDSNLSNYSFVSLNSSNMFDNIMDLDKKFSEFNSKEEVLENCLLIIDEAHNLFNAITNGAKNAIALYDKILESKNIKLLFMSGTPCINHPFELVPCYNMLYGINTTGGADEDEEIEINHRYADEFLDLEENGLLGGNENSFNLYFNKRETLFTEDLDEFNSYFVDDQTNLIKNKEKFVDRIYGLTSYYGDWFIEDNQLFFPTLLENKIIRVPMSDYQYARYEAVRDKERSEAKFTYKGKKSRFASNSGASSTYRVKSRQISNFCMPEEAFTNNKKDINKITNTHLNNLKTYSPKMLEMFDNIKLHTINNEPGIVYSQFVTGEGLNVFSRFLKLNNWNTNENKPNFTILSGEISAEERAKIIIDFNNNFYNLLLLSSAGAEGIDLKGVRHIHIMEPFWNYARINQVITRGVRYKSHEHLPENQRTVQPYIYLADHPIKAAKKAKELTTDVELYTNSLNNMKLINSFLQAVAESSFDCTAHNSRLPKELQDRLLCRICAPTKDKLFHPNFKKDMALPSTCLSYSESKISVKTVEFNGIKYFYTENPIKVYEFDKKINANKLMTISSKNYGEIISKILEQ